MKPPFPLRVALPGIAPLRIALGLLLALSAGHLQAQCPLTCFGQTNLSLGPDGSATFTPQNGLANIQPLCLPDYSAMLFDPWGAPVENPLGCSRLGQNLTFKITYTPNGNHCWGQVLIEDKLAPALICSGATIPCNEPVDSTGLLLATDNCDSNPAILLAFEEIRDLGCDDPQQGVREVERHWFARDFSGNDSPLCIQLIRILRAGLADVRFPPDRTGADAIPCATPDIDPDVTGYPLVFGGDNHPLCKVLFTYEDDTLATCPGGFLVNRTWTALDCCTSEILTEIQVIEVADIQPPLIKCPADLTINTKEDTCTADFTLPLATTTDACSPGVALSIATSWGGSGPGPYFNLPEGGYKVHYTAVDSCGNSATCTIDFVIKDQVPPVALCKLPVFAYLNAAGVDTIRFEDVDGGSFDNCTMTMGQVKLMGEPDSLFRDSILVDCSFIDRDTMIILRISDCWNNTAICMTSLITLDTLPPFFLCPPDTVLSCTAFADYPDIGGVAFASDNCAGHTLSREDDAALNDCGVGTILRTWRAEDTFGNLVSCTQTISLIDTTAPTVVWPADITVSCAASIDPLFSGQPETGDNCALLAVGFRDSLIVVDNGCDTLFRIWRVSDWCTAFDTTHIQRIDLIDPVPILEINCPDDLTIFLADSCEIAVFLDPVSAFDECGHYNLLSNDSPYALEGGPDASGIYPIGVHTITFTIRDACFLTTCQTILEVRDTVPPLLTCNDLVECIGLEGTYFLDPAQVVLQAFDLCGPVSLQVEPSAFNCDDLWQALPVTVTATDLSGNTSQCEQILFLLDCDNVCPEGFTGGGVIVEGQIRRWDEEPLADVPVVFDFGLHKIWTLTNAEGRYRSPAMPAGVDLKVTAHPVPGDLAGISTADVMAIGQHLLGQKPLTLAEAWLAADINRSGTLSIADMVALRRAILHQWSGLQAGFWRMAPTALLESGLASLQESGLWEGTYQLLDVSLSLHELHFTAIKAGDVDGSSRPGALQGPQVFRYLDIREAPRALRAGEQVSLTFAGPAGERLAGFQLCLAYPDAALRFEGLQARGLSNLGPEHLMAASPGLIRFSWDNLLQPVSAGEEALFTLTFTALRDLEGHEWLWLQRDGYEAEYYFAQEQKATVVLRWPEQSAAPFIRETVLHPARPNPFTAQTRIDFDLALEGPASLSVYDLNGRLVHEQRGLFPAGAHSFLIPGSDLPGPGQYHYQLRTTTGVLIRQMHYAR
jgi:hypothetical protein